MLIIIPEFFTLFITDIHLLKYVFQPLCFHRTYSYFRGSSASLLGHTELVLVITAELLTNSDLHLQHETELIYWLTIIHRKCGNDFLFSK